MIVKIKTAKHKSAGIIASREGNHGIEYLFVLSRWSKRWGFPKGHAEINETVMDTAIREAHEETGMLFRIPLSSNKVNINKTSYYIVNNANLNCENYSFTPKPIDVNEIVVCKWMTLQNMDYIVDKFPDRVTRDVKLFLSKNHTKHNNTKINNLSFKNCKSSHITNIKDIINNPNTDFKNISVN